MSRRRRSSLLSGGVLSILFPAVISAQPGAPDQLRPPPSPQPIEIYKKRGLLPGKNNMESVRRRRLSDGAGVLTGLSSAVSVPGTFLIDLTDAARVVNSRSVIRNTGDVAVTDPWVVANGERNWFSCGSIVREAVETERDRELRAFRLWNLMRRGRYHWLPAETGIELHSPVRYLNVYGYGFCDDSATNLEALWKLAGLTSRTWAINGHVVSEVHYQGAYHVLDADLECFYPLRTHQGAAGARQLARDARLIDRISPEVTSMYTATEDDIIYQNWWDTTCTMAMALRPGESLERCHYNWGKFHDNNTGLEPPAYGNGRQIWIPDLADSSRSIPGFSPLVNVQWNDPSAGKAPLVTPEVPDEPMTLTWTMKSAYVFVGGSANFHLRALDSGCSAEIAFRKTSRSPWKILETFTGPYDGNVSVPLDSALDALDSPACYSFDLRVVLSSESGQSGDVGIDSLTATGEIQCNPRSLPTLLAQRSNSIATAFKPFTAAATPRLKVFFEWEQHTDLPPYAPPCAPISPADGAVVESVTPVLSWESEFEGDDRLWRKVVVSWDAGGHRPVSPLTMAAQPMDNEWQVPEDCLLPNTTYYWRVREGDELLSQWSPTWSFTTGAQTPVALSSMEVH